LKGRDLEIPASGSFLLIEHFLKINTFFKDAKKITFKTKEELLKKIKYYLKHKETREKLAEKYRQQVLKNYTWEILFKNFFSKTIQDNPRKELPKLNKKIVTISREDFLNSEKLKKKLNGGDYICFSEGKCKVSPYKNYFQAYSLEKSKKQISCCDYCVHSEDLGDYLIFKAKQAFKTINKEDFSALLNMNQLMVSKSYFLKNFDLFKRMFHGKVANIINEKNTVFISIPLIKIEDLKTINYNGMKEAFRMLFLDKLYSLAYQKKIFFSSYPYKLLLGSIFGKIFIFRYLFESLFNKENWAKVI